MMKSSLRSDEIAVAVGGFYFICEADFIGISRFHPCTSKDFIKTILNPHSNLTLMFCQKPPHY
jgi:hypothetical protein